MPYKVRDNIHGTILFSALEKQIIDHPIFQRLREIRQLAFLRFVFPSATHSRFEHSVGAMHLADQAFLRMIDSQEALLDALDLASSKKERVKILERPLHGDLESTRPVVRAIRASEDEYRVRLRLAMLLHDVGHGPFSHSGEVWYPALSEVVEANKKLMTPSLRRLMQEKLAEDPRAQATHEDLSLFLISRIARDVRDFTAEIADDVISIVGKVKLSKKPTPRELIRVLLHDLIANEIDADRMDYLIRDSRMCGVSYGEFDHDRLIDSFAFYNRESANGLVPTLALKYSGLQAFEDYLLSRYQMYSQVYFHKTAIAFDAMMNHISVNLPLRFPASVDEYVALTDSGFPKEIEGVIRKLKDRRLARRLGRAYDGVFRHRDPWKRIYELNMSLSESDSDLGSDRVVISDEVAKFCDRHNVGYHVIEAEKWFTRLLPRTQALSSENRLRLIKKNVYGIPFVLPIEQYSPIIHSFMRRINVVRIYVEGAYKQPILSELDERFRRIRALSERQSRLGKT